MKSYIDIVLEDFWRDLEETRDVVTAMENTETSASFLKIDESEEYIKQVDHLQIEMFDIDRFIKVNDCKEVTNPVFYQRDNIPTVDGLLSNEIFGITQEERAGIFGYINLEGWYLDPSCYKAWIRLDRRIKQITHGTMRVKLDKAGNIIEDPDGETGLEFLKKNIENIKFKETESDKQNLKRRYLEHNRHKMFINKYIVIPPFTRDTNTGKRSVGVGGVNKLYSQLLVAVGSTSVTQEYGFDMSASTQARVQECMLNLYDWFCGNTNEAIGTKDEGVGLAGKRGIMSRAVMSKTSNYAARLVLSAPDLKAHRPEDMMVDFDKCAIPLHAVIATFRPFIQYHVRRFFENEFMGTEQYPVVKEDGSIEYVTPKDPLIVFSDDRIKEEMEKFIHGYNNRFVPIEVPIENYKKKVYMRFKGRSGTDNITTESIMNRRLTWCDIFFKAAVDATRDKMVLITRYPVDTRFNEIATGVQVSSTIKTEPMYINDTFYKFYPYIREEDIGKNTGNKFIDTLIPSNLYLSGMGGDYDGDTVTVKGCYTQEVNSELHEFMNSKQNFLDLGCRNVRDSKGDAVHSIFCLTRILEPDQPKLTQNIKFKVV